MADYGSSGIWAMGPVGLFRHGMMEHEDLDLPAKLARQFDEWIMTYSARLGTPDQALDTVSFNSTGRALATELKRFLGSAYDVEYIPENEDGSLGEAENIIDKNDHQ